MTWEAGGFERVRRGAMVMRGQAKLPMETMLEMSSRWLQTSAELEPLPLEGGHLAELLLDNRQGHAYAILDLLLRKQGVMAPATADELVASFEYVASCRLWGDVTAADAGLLGLRVTLREETREFAAEADEHLRVTSERLLGDLSDHLAERYAVDMRRLESGVDDGVYTARYEIAPLSGLFTQRRSGAARDRTRAPRPAEPPAT
jgi:hypothetical protein